MKINKKFSRYLALYIFVGLFFLLILTRLFYLQLIKSEDAQKTIITQLSLTEKVSAPRGKICDRNGNVLAGNRQGFIVLVKKRDDLSLAVTVKNLSKLVDMTYDELLSDIKKHALSYNNPFVFLEDAEPAIITKIKESPEKYPCVEIVTKPVREYFYPELAVHLLGRCGLISKSEYSELSGYSYDDYIGKQGAEKAFEKILKGQDGRRAREKYTGKEVKKFTQNIEPIAGNDVFLTIDLPLQQAAEDALSSVVSSTPNALGGSAIVMEVNSGEILALASNPDYNLAEFNKKYTELSKNKNKPFFNRCLSGLYEPGSTFKPITAIAALESKKTNAEEQIKTLGKYEYFDQVFKCNIYREKGSTHGRIDIKEALGVSCNYFFYELGKRVGIDALSEVAQSFGLDSATGIELTQEEAIGTIATPENRKDNGGHWYAGDTLQSAIGQSDNRFTPIALCNYAAALANGGTLYSAHVLKGVLPPGGKIEYTVPKILNTIDISDETMQTINDGMVYVTKKGTAKEIFRDFPITVAGKTGTAQVSKRTNGLFIGYAPLDAPKIAFCVVVEGGASGNQAAKIAKKILQQYFNIVE